MSKVRPSYRAVLVDDDELRSLATHNVLRKIDIRTDIYRSYMDAREHADNFTDAMVVIVDLLLPKGGWDIGPVTTQDRQEWGMHLIHELREEFAVAAAFLLITAGWNLGPIKRELDALRVTPHTVKTVWGLAEAAGRLVAAQLGKSETVVDF